MTKVIRHTLLTIVFLGLAGCATKQYKDSDPISVLNPPAAEMQMYNKYGIKTVGDWKAVVKEMKDSGYALGGGSYTVMFDYLRDKEAAQKSPGLTAAKVQQQRIDAAIAEKKQKEARNQKILNELFSAKWSIGDLPCNRNGGTYSQFGNNYKIGIRSVINGRLNETDQRAMKRFTVNEDGTVTLYYEIYADGNRLMTQMLGSRNAVVGYTTTNYRVDGNKLYSESKISRLDLQRLADRRGVGYETSTYKSVSTKCRS